MGNSKIGKIFQLFFSTGNISTAVLPHMVAYLYDYRSIKYYRENAIP